MAGDGEVPSPSLGRSQCRCGDCECLMVQDLDKVGAGVVIDVGCMVATVAVVAIVEVVSAVVGVKVVTGGGCGHCTAMFCATVVTVLRCFDTKSSYLLAVR